MNQPSTAAPPLVIRQVSKRYGKVNALRDVTFSAEPAEAIALWGQNGAGKTTLLKAILGLIRFDGTIVVEGQDVRRQSKAARRSIGYVPQEANFYDWSVLATMRFYARLKKIHRQPGVDAPARVAALLDRLGLTEHAHKSVSALSGGLKQRLALAVALLADPPILLLDEPTANLDAQARRDYLGLLASLRREGKTIIFASHRFEELETLADKVVLLEQGELVEIVAPEELRAKYSPEVEMVLWLPEAHRHRAMTVLTGQGLPAHLNGRGTVVVAVESAAKARLLDDLSRQGISVLNFEMEQVQKWN
jgi:ABC-type multidrug transport system ATPase subunit